MTSKKIDKIDRKILNELMEDPKKPLRAIAADLKVSFVTVMNRIKKLEQAGVIQEYSVKVNYNELGYDIHAIIELNIERGKWDDYERKILPLVNIYSAYEVTGETDVLLMLRFKNTKELGDFLEKLQSFGFIKSSNTKLVTYTDKDEFIKI